MLEKKLNNIEQQNLTNCIEITNVTNKAISARETVLAIARASNITMESSDVIDAYHHKRKNKIFAKLSALSIKRELMQRAKERKLSNADINLKSNQTEDKNKTTKTNNNHIYINDQLTTLNKKLFWLSKTKAKSNNWKFVWIKEGKILLKKKRIFSC